MRKKVFGAVAESEKLSTYALEMGVCAGKNVAIALLH